MESFFSLEVIKEFKRISSNFVGEIANQETTTRIKIELSKYLEDLKHMAIIRRWVNFESPCGKIAFCIATVDFPEGVILCAFLEKRSFEEKAYGNPPRCMCENVCYPKAKASLI